jgi:hypothetical protein
VHLARIHGEQITGLKQNCLAADHRGALTLRDQVDLEHLLRMVGIVNSAVSEAEGHGNGAVPGTGQPALPTASRCHDVRLPSGSAVVIPGCMKGMRGSRYENRSRG